jgi:hypothetical protein
MKGRCLCGFVRFEARGIPSNETSCHCSICRRSSGAPYVAWFTVRRDDFSFSSGEPATFRSSDHGTRAFCPRCGTQLTFQSTRFPDEIDVTIAALDDPELVRPRDHTFAASRVAWDVLDDALPVFAEERTK